MAAVTNTRRFLGVPMTWRSLIMSAGLAFIAPYIVRRVMPLLDGRSLNPTSDDFILAGKNAARDAADDLDVGGVSGKLNRTVDRVSDQITH
jgi:hypothetical protein